MKILKILVLILLLSGLSGEVIAQSPEQELDPRCPDELYADHDDFYLVRVENLPYVGVSLDTCIYTNGEYELHMPIDEVLGMGFYSWLGHLRSCDAYVTMPSNEFEFYSYCARGEERGIGILVQLPSYVVFSLNWQAYDGEYKLKGDGIFSYRLGNFDWKAWNVESIQRDQCPEYAKLTPEDEFVAHLFEATAFPGVCRYLHPEGFEIWLIGNLAQANAIVDERASLCVNLERQTTAFVWEQTIYPEACIGEDNYGMPFLLE